MGDDGTGDQLGKVGNKGGILQELVLLHLAPVGVHDVAELLEGEEADAQGKQDIVQGKIRVGETVHIHQEKVEILVVEQDAQIEDDCQDHFGFFQLRILGTTHEPGKQVIEDDGAQNDEQVAGVKVAVEPQGHDQKPGLTQIVFFEMVQSEIADHAQREEQQKKDIGIEQQGRDTSRNKTEYRADKCP